MGKRPEPKLPPGWTWSWRKGGEAICPHGVGHDYGVHGCHFNESGKPCCSDPQVSAVLGRTDG